MQENTYSAFELMAFENKSSKRKLTFGTWNVNGLKKKKREVFSEIERENVDVVVLTETKLHGTGEEKFGNYIHMWSGVEESEHGSGGVSFLIKEMYNENKAWEAIHSRLAKISLEICGQRIVVIGVYWVDNCSTSIIKDRFQTGLIQAIRNVNDNEELVIMGDMNARVGIMQNSKVVGVYGEIETNDNGRRLINICQTFGLRIQNGFFEHDDIDKYTWRHRRLRRKTIIDYFITRQTSSLEVLDVVARRRRLECGTDHSFLEARVLLPLLDNDALNLIQEQKFEIRYKTYLLFCRSVQSMYSSKLAKKIDLETKRTTEEMYQLLKKSVRDVAIKVLGVQSKRNHEAELWWNEECERFINTDNQMDDNKITELTETKNEIWSNVCDVIDMYPELRGSKMAQGLLDELQYGSRSDHIISVQDTRLVTHYFKKLLTEDRAEFKTPSNENRRKSSGELSVTVTDILQALEDPENFKVVSGCEIPLELLRYGGVKLIQLLTDLIQNVFRGEVVPLEIKDVIITDISEGTNRLGFFEYNGTFVQNPIMIIMQTIIRNVLLQKDPLEVDSIFVPKFLTLDIIFVLRLLVEKTEEKQKSIHFAFFDLRETYSDIPHAKLFAYLQNLGIRANVMNVIKRLCSGNSFRTQVAGRLSEPFSGTKGLIKDSSLSAMLFKLYMAKTLRKWKSECMKLGFPVGNDTLTSFFTADSLVIIAKHKKYLRAMIMSLKKHFVRKSIPIDTSKIKYMGLGNGEGLTVETYKLKCLDKVEFLGAVLQADGKSDEEMYDKVIQAKNGIGILSSVASDEMISVENKKRIFDSIIKNILTCGCETWIMIKDFKEKMSAVELDFWRRCCEKGSERISGESLFTMMDVEQDIYKVVINRKYRWREYIHTMNCNEIPNKIFRWNPRGTNKRGRPRMKWIDEIPKRQNYLTVVEQKGDDNDDSNWLQRISITIFS